MTKEIQDLISEEAEKGYPASEMYKEGVRKAFVAGASAYAGKMEGFAEWTQDQNYTYLGEGVWELSELLPRFRRYFWSNTSFLFY